MNKSYLILIQVFPKLHWSMPHYKMGIWIRCEWGRSYDFEQNNTSKMPSARIWLNRCDFLKAAFLYKEALCHHMQEWLLYTGYFTLFPFLLIMGGTITNCTMTLIVSLLVVQWLIFLFIKDSPSSHRPDYHKCHCFHHKPFILPFIS